MSTRGRQLFDRYVVNSLNNPTLASLGLYSHVHNFIEQARADAIPMKEVLEEVGPIPQAFAAALRG